MDRKKDFGEKKRKIHVGQATGLNGEGSIIYKNSSYNEKIQFTVYEHLKDAATISRSQRGFCFYTFSTTMIVLVVGINNLNM